MAHSSSPSDASPLLDHLTTLYPFACLLVGPDEAPDLLLHVYQKATERPRTERPEDLQVFSAERMAGRILQMGDIVGLVERAQQTIDEDATKRMEEKIRGDGEFDLEDFLTSLRQLQNMGPLDNILKMLPGVKPEMLEAVDTDPERIKHMEAIVLSMTPEERRQPRVLDGSRRARIAEGAGRPVHEVNQLVKRFGEMKKMMKKMQGGGGPGGGMGSLMGGGGGKLDQMKQMLS